MTLVRRAQPKSSLRRKNRRGQGMTEYIIIVALIAIAAIGVITLFGDNVRQLFAASAQALAGNDTVSNQGQTASQSTLKKNLSNFGTNNAY
jgi:pilus assembly protein Flp/PilA